MKKKNQCKQLGDTLNEKKISVNTSSQEIPTMKKNQIKTK